MARRRKQINKGLAFFLSVMCFIIGTFAGVFGKIYFAPDDTYIIPETEVVSKSTYNSGDINIETIKSQELSIHFLELGNKYTGDCTFIKVGDTEILIDAGSRADSVTPIYNYISQYITDGILEYVIVTHAHQDHYAGFATGANTDSLFDKLNVQTVIKFAGTNQKATSTLYANFNRELAETKNNPDKNTKVYDALQCINNEDGASKTYNLSASVELEILDQKYYRAKATTENNYSVCCMINQTTGVSEKHYLFTGDLEADGEKSLVSLNSLPEVELYKAGHHGSKTSSSDSLLSVVKPKVVCVCACAGSTEYTTKNENTFPTQQFIDRVSLYTDNIFVTSLCIDYNKGEFTSFNGNIIVASNGANLETNLYFSNNSKKLKDTDWFKQNRTIPQKWVA